MKTNTLLELFRFQSITLDVNKYEICGVVIQTKQAMIE